MNETLTSELSLPRYLPLSRQLARPVTAMMRERRDEFVHWDLILLSAAFSQQLSVLSLLVSGSVLGLQWGKTRKHHLSERCTLLNYP